MYLCARGFTFHLSMILIKFKTRSNKYLFIWMISYKDPERSSLICSWIENITTEREILLGLQ
jgi:hypothetical protein